MRRAHKRLRGRAGLVQRSKLLWDADQPGRYPADAAETPHAGSVEDKRLARMVGAINAFHTRHGFLIDEFSTI